MYIKKIKPINHYTKAKRYHTLDQVAEFNDNILMPPSLISNVYQSIRIQSTRNRRTSKFAYLPFINNRRLTKTMKLHSLIKRYMHKV